MCPNKAYDAVHPTRFADLLMPNLALTSITARNCREWTEATTRDNTSFRCSPEARKGMAQSLDCGGPGAAKFGLLLLIDSRGMVSGPAPYCQLSRKRMSRHKSTRPARFVAFAWMIRFNISQTISFFRPRLRYRGSCQPLHDNDGKGARIMRC